MKASAKLQSRINELEASAAESLLAQVSATATAANANDRVQMLDHGLAATQADLAASQARATAVEAELEQLRRKLQVAERSIEDLERDVRTARAED